MKTPEEWTKRLLTECDVMQRDNPTVAVRFAKVIADIQRDARKCTVPVEDVRPLLEAVNAEANNNDEQVTLSGWITIERCLMTLRAKHPNLFSK